MPGLFVVQPLSRVLFVMLSCTLTAENKSSRRKGAKSSNFFNDSHWLIFVDERNYSFIKSRRLIFCPFAMFLRWMLNRNDKL